MKIFTQAAVKKGLKTKDLAELCGVSEETVYLWKSGQAIPETTHLKILSGVLEVEVSKLLDNFYFENLPKIIKKVEAERLIREKEEKENMVNDEYRENLTTDQMLALLKTIILKAKKENLKYGIDISKQWKAMMTSLEKDSKFVDEVAQSSVRVLNSDKTEPLKTIEEKLLKKKISF